MAQYQVPQFIEVEAKIIGPFTLKQFLWLAAAGGVIFILYFMLIKWVWLILSFFIAAAAISFAVIKINGRPLFSFVGNFFTFVFKPRLMLWSKEAYKEKIEPSVPLIEKIGSPKITSASANRRPIGIKNLSMKLLTGEANSEEK